jgi:beta-lactamase regulating signal transducer with metallopeptidase domain
MNATMLVAVTAWLLTVALHGGILLFLLWLSEQFWHTPRAWRELLWRCALFGGVVTASLQPIAGVSPATAFLSLHVHSNTTVSNALANTAHQPQSSRQDAQATSATLPANSHPEAAHIDTASRTGASNQTSRSIDLSLAWRLSECLITGWLLGAVFNLMRLLRSLTRLHRSLRAAISIGPDDDSSRAVSALCMNTKLHEPTLYSLRDIASPMAVLPARIVLPAWALESLDAGKLRAMVAHELAHIARHDPQWKLLVACWRAVFWFLPLAALAQRRLDEVAELACDAFAAYHTGNARNVAECLAACAERQVNGPSRRYALAPAMAAHESSFLQRIDCLLEGTSMQPHRLPLRHRVLALSLLAGCGFVLPAISFVQPGLAQTASATPQEPKEKAASGATKSRTNSSVSISDDDGKQSMSISVSDDNHSFSAKVDGKIAFSSSESDVESLSAGGTANFEEQRAGVIHRMEFSERNGKLERQYFVDKREQPLDASASTWLASFLPAMIRETGLGAEARFGRILAKGGAAAVLDECQEIHSEYARGIYLDLLADHGPLAPADLDRALKLAGSFDSNYTRHQVLSRFFAKQTLSGAQQVTFLQQAENFNSDYERAELLIGVLPKLADTAAVRQTWLTAALGLSSDYEKQRTLKALLAHQNVDDRQLDSMITASQSIHSDHERGELLIAIARRAHDVEAIAPAYAQSTRDLGSDYTRRETLLALINSGNLGTRGSTAVLDSMAGFGSGYDSREVLVALAHVMPDDKVLLDRYRKVAAGFSDSDRAQAERALVR